MWTKLISVQAYCTNKKRKFFAPPEQNFRQNFSQTETPFFPKSSVDVELGLQKKKNIDGVTSPKDQPP